MSKNNEVQKVKEKIDGFVTKYADRQVYGYKKAEDTTTRKVGERWVDDDGNTWEQREGYRMKNPDAEIYKPLTSCPKCKKYANSKADIKMLIFHKLCMDCVAEIETQLRIEGKWEEYERTKVKENIRSYIKDTEQQVEEYVKNLTESVSYFNIANVELGTIDYEKWETTKEDVEQLKSAALLTLKMMHEDFEKSFGEKVHKEQSETQDVDKGDIIKST